MVIWSCLFLFWFKDIWLTIMSTQLSSHFLKIHASLSWEVNKDLAPVVIFFTNMVRCWTWSLYYDEVEVYMISVKASGYTNNFIFTLSKGIMWFKVAVQIGQKQSSISRWCIHSPWVLFYHLATFPFHSYFIKLQYPRNLW